MKIMGKFGKRGTENLKIKFKNRRKVVKIWLNSDEKWSILDGRFNILACGTVIFSANFNEIEWISEGKTRVKW